MPTIYLDTSAAVPLFVREASSAIVDAWYEGCADKLIAS
jgi:predicted nucleic acid-binding protein